MIHIQAEKRAKLYVKFDTTYHSIYLEKIHWNYIVCIIQIHKNVYTYETSKKTANMGQWW